MHFVLQISLFKFFFTKNTFKDKKDFLKQESLLKLRIVSVCTQYFLIYQVFF